MPIFPIPSLFGPSTEEQRIVALQSTRETLTKLRDLLRELDLPADKLDLAVEIYGVQLGGLMQTEQEKKHREKAKRLRAKYEASGGRGPVYPGPGQGYVPMMPPFDLADFDDED